MNQSRHKRAIKRVLICLLFVLPPVLYLGYQYQNNVILDIEKFGVVPEFQMMFHNHDRGMTHMDTTSHVTVVAIAKDHCKQGCDQLVAEMNSLKAYFEKELEGQDRDPNTPRRTRFVVQTESGFDNFPEGWDVADMSMETPYLVPEVKSAGPFPAFVLIDDGSYYRGFVPLSDARLQEKLQTELTRIISNQYLLHYVTRQTLMWRRANGREKIKHNNQSH